MGTESQSAETIATGIDPQRLDNPDADIRYKLPDILVEQSAGLIVDDGYDYVGSQPLLVMFLKCTDLQKAISCVLHVIQHVRPFGNDLRPATTIAILRDGECKVIFPAGFSGGFDL